MTLFSGTSTSAFGCPHMWTNLRYQIKDWLTDTPYSQMADTREKTGA